MSRDLILRICRVVFVSLAIMVFAFLVSLFNPSAPVRMAQIQPEITNSADGKQRNPSALIVQKGAARPAVQEEPAQASPSQMKAGLETLREMALKKTILFAPQPLERQPLDANSLVSEGAVLKLTSTEISQPRWGERVVTANASTAPLSIEMSSIEMSQETKLQPDPDRPPQLEPRDALTGKESLTYKRDTNKKLNSHTAIRANQSIIGSWSTGTCRSTKTTDTRLSISSRRAKSSTGSVCEFRDLQWANHEWRVKANCSQGTQHWVANGRFALMANKLVWTSERDVISYSRCN